MPDAVAAHVAGETSRYLERLPEGLVALVGDGTEAP